MRSSEDVELTTDAFYEALLDDNVEDLYENAPCGYLSTLPDGVIVKVNQTFLGWTGFRRDDLIGKRRFADLLTAGGRIFYETHLAPMLQMQDRVREIAADVKCPDGRRLPVLVNGVLRRDESGEPLVVRVAIFDATERRAYEQELLRARQQAEASEERARALARTLQATFIPPEPPTMAGLDVGAAYRPAGDGDEVGGDFYDVFETGEGTWAAVLGDVCGKGVDAAAVTSLARYTTRAAAVHEVSPRRILETLNAAILRQHVDRFCTALYVRIDVRELDAVRLTVCSGGHLLPLRVDRSGAVSTVGSSGSLLGVFDEVELDEAEVVLGPGETLVLYTDGVTEARDLSGGFYGASRLMDVLGEATASETARGVADRVLEDVLAFQHGAPRDDIALLVLKRPS